MKVAVLIDGGHLRVVSRIAGHRYIPDFIEKIAHICVGEGETLLRALYYDCAPYNGKARKPISGDEIIFDGSDSWLKELARKDLFAVRKGELKFRGFKPRRVPIGDTALSDDDFKPDFEQKGVDMRIGLDMANFAYERSVERIILVSGDTDCIPAMKLARIAGLQVVLVEFDNHKLAPELLWHSDIRRHVGWPQ
ncbi:NYN domain-containing protein [uncultured Martelella sp.]|uniref:NYN domain-containing protein n=1 Tax=uncultured Martelella sp. TaxID=392331 RepID=UPI0029C6FEC5|nr:NYN domain-containing protein [uncultured Martelella sp.]